MKLRIWRNSLRLRLSQSEVARLASGGRVEESLEIGNGAPLRYAVGAAGNGDAITARFEDGLLQVFVPAAQARAWADSEDVGVYAESPRHIAIEKDFRCVDAPETENAPDAYPNPSPSCSEK
ncbi:MAG: DUF7009 family protein [Bryobacteraceae bacterium]